MLLNMIVNSNIDPFYSNNVSHKAIKNNSSWCHIDKTKYERFIISWKRLSDFHNVT